MRISRCPRCLAEDITTDAHPARVLRESGPQTVLVCRSCYRPAELGYRIACENAGRAYDPLLIRDGLRALRDFYLDRLAEWRSDDLLIEDHERDAATARIRSVLDDVERRLRIAPVDSTA